MSKSKCFVFFPVVNMIRAFIVGMLLECFVVAGQPNSQSLEECLLRPFPKNERWENLIASARSHLVSRIKDNGIAPEKKHLQGGFCLRSVGRLIGFST